MYNVVIRPTALKEFNRLPSVVQNNIEQIIERLKNTPRPHGCIKLSGSIARWRIRVGDYRILYEIDDNNRTVRLYRIAHRKEVYRAP